ncbi:MULTISPECIES: hypothetical protein [unclassified Nocardioides]|uniref:hypothetical protein n=1 Tax=unclassified Nocardioides TaxID=2615069 RepID=UPI00301532D8
MLATLVGVSGLALALARQEWLGVGRGAAMTVVFALAGARHRYDELPGRVELVGLVAAGAWPALTVAPYL